MVNRILRVNVGDRSFSWEEAGDGRQTLGGRGLTARILLDEVKPDCDPLGRHNKLVLAPGLLGGWPIPSSGRTSVGAKSPLTGGIKESNGGGITAAKLARLGIKAVIIEGVPADDSLFILKIDRNGCEFVPADRFRGMGNYALAREMLGIFGPQIGMASIGPAGEKLLASAGIANLDMEGNPSRYCGRGGLGAVMGSKGLKALVVDDRGTPVPPVHDRDKFKTTVREYIKILKDSPVIAGYTRLGTAGILAFTNALGCLPTRNFQKGRFERAAEIDGDALYRVITSRGGEGRTTHRCMPGCVISCSNVFPDQNGKNVVSPLEYETIGLFGANCCIGNLDDIARLNYLCNDLGLDTIETAVSVGVAMEAGLVRFGDAAGATDLVGQIGRETLLGRVLGAGAVTAGKVLGVAKVPAVKGQAMPAYDPRSLKGLGVTYAVSPMGADHTAGTTIRAQVDHLDPQGQVALSRRSQLMVAVYDSLGLCIFVSAALGPRPEVLAELLNSCYGWQWDVPRMNQLAIETIRTEHRFNQLAGFSSVHDRLPEFFCEVPNPDTNSVFDVPQEEIDGCYDFLS